MSRFTAIICAVIILLLVSMAWAVNHYRDNAIAYKYQRDKESSRADASEAVTGNVLQTIRLNNIVMEANQHAKSKITLDTQRAKESIRVAVAGDSCADRPVPAAAVKRLQDHANSLREGASGASASKPDI